MHRGRRFLNKNADVKVKDILEASGDRETVAANPLPCTEAQEDATDAAPSPVSNVIVLRPRLLA